MRAALSTICRLVLGPLCWPGLLRKIAGLALILGLTVLTQVGGILVWPALGLASGARRRGCRALGFGLLAHGAGLWLVPPLASAGGRVPLPCGTSGPLRPRSVLYCLAHRRYVTPALAEEAEQIAREVAGAHPGTVVRYLDAAFPLFDGVPLLPHLSHHDGRKLDLALLYQDAEGEPIDGGGSPLGYFGYVPLPEGASPACPPSWRDLRWDLDLLQPLLAPRLDVERTRALVRAAAGRQRIGKILLEPHLRLRLGVGSDKVRFQGCHAARHDDHLHVQLR